MPKKKPVRPSSDPALAELQQRAAKILKATEDSVRRLRLIQAEIEQRLRSRNPNSR